MCIKKSNTFLLIQCVQRVMVRSTQKIQRKRECAYIIVGSIKVQSELSVSEIGPQIFAYCFNFQLKNL